MRALSIRLGALSNPQKGNPPILEDTGYKYQLSTAYNHYETILMINWNPIETILECMVQGCEATLVGYALSQKRRF